MLQLIHQFTLIFDNYHVIHRPQIAYLIGTKSTYSQHL